MCLFVSVCVLIKDVDRRLALELQCSLYKDQQGNVYQNVCARNLCKPFLRGGGSDPCGMHQFIVYIYPVVVAVRGVVVAVRSGRLTSEGKGRG